MAALSIRVLRVDGTVVTSILQGTCASGNRLRLGKLIVVGVAMVQSFAPSAREALNLTVVSGASRTW